MSCARMGDAIAHRGPDGEGHVRRGPGRPRPTGAWRSSTSRPGATADGERLGRPRHHLQRRDLQLPRAAGRARGARARASAPDTDTEVVLHAYEEWGADCLDRFNGMFAFAIWDRARARAASSPATASASSRSTTPRPAARLVFGSEVKALLAHPRRARGRSACRTCSSTSPSRTSSPTGPCSRACGCCPPGHHLTIGPEGGPVRTERYWDFEFRERRRRRRVRRGAIARSSTGCFRQAVERQLVSRRPGRRPALRAAWTPAASPRSPRRSLPYLNTFTGRLRHELERRARARLSTSARRPRRCPTCSGPSTTRSVLKAGDMERCLPALIWHLEDLRVGQSYPNYYVARLASKFVKVVLTGSGGDELFAGYPWRYYRAVVNEDFDDYVDKYYRFWSPPRSRQTLQPGFFAPDVWDQVSDVRHGRHLPLDASPTRTPAADARGVHQPLALPRGQDLPARPVRRRGQAEHGPQPREPRARSSTTTWSTSRSGCPVRLKLRDLAGGRRAERERARPEDRSATSRRPATAS